MRRPLPAAPVDVSVMRMQSAIRRPQEAPLLSTDQKIKVVLNEIEGTYKFRLDAFQEGWTDFYLHLISANTSVSMSLVQNPSPNSQQLLIHTLSEGDPPGQFCTVQSSFELNRDFISRPTLPVELTARRSFSNRGSIGDIYGAQNRIEIQNPSFDNISYRIWFSGEDDSEESVFVKPSQRLKNPVDFGSLCRSCGFQISPNGLCQER